MTAPGRRDGSGALLSTGRSCGTRTGRPPSGHRTAGRRSPGADRRSTHGTGRSRVFFDLAAPERPRRGGRRGSCVAGATRVEDTPAHVVLADPTATSSGSAAPRPARRAGRAYRWSAYGPVAVRILAGRRRVDDDRIAFRRRLVSSWSSPPSCCCWPVAGSPPSSTRQVSNYAEGVWWACPCSRGAVSWVRCPHPPEGRAVAS